MTRHLIITCGPGRRDTAVEFVRLLGAWLEARSAPGALRPVPEPRRGSLTFEVCAEPSWLAAELGTHVLLGVAGKGTGRRRWFARVLLREAATVERPSEPDLAAVTRRYCRAGGPGGQHVNKRATAVVLTHEPTGTRVREEGTRSREQNERRAFQRLRDLLKARASDRAACERAALHLDRRRLDRDAIVREHVLGSDGKLRGRHEI